MFYFQVLFNLPMILDIVYHADDELYEDNLLIVKDAYQVLTAVVTVGGDKGRSAFVNNRGVHSLCEVVVKQTFQYEDALTLLMTLLSSSGQTCWTYHQGFEDFNRLMVKLCTDFAACQASIPIVLDNSNQK